jgi:hypothetical protein
MRIAAGIVALIVALILFINAGSDYSQREQDRGRLSLHSSDSAYQQLDREQTQYMIEGTAGAAFLVAGLALCVNRKKTLPAA